jgi:hypothetical protein
MPLRPVVSADQVSGALNPTGVTAPKPVMATLREAFEAGMVPKGDPLFADRQVFDFGPPV